MVVVVVAVDVEVDVVEALVGLEVSVVVITVGFEVALVVLVDIVCDEDVTGVVVIVPSAAILI